MILDSIFVSCLRCAGKQSKLNVLTSGQSTVDTVQMAPPGYLSQLKSKKVTFVAPAAPQDIDAAVDARVLLRPSAEGALAHTDRAASAATVVSAWTASRRR